MPSDRGHTVVLGASGMLGRAWRAAAPDLDSNPPVFHDRAACDITNDDAVRSALDEGVRVVINCAAFTDVDGAESRADDANRINGLGPAVLARRCRDIGALLVHYSTDYVFNGKAGSPYAVDHPRDPVNAYGRSKLIGEEAIEASGCEYLILRTSWLYDAHGKNFVSTIARLARERDSLRVVHDQRGRPSSCRQLVRTTKELLRAEARGTMHATDGGECTWCDLATHIASRVNPACVVAPCTTAEFPRPAPRPAYSVLDISSMESLIGPRREWRLEVDDILPQIVAALDAGG